MKVLLLTPLYYIKGRPNLFHDTSAIHYLIKYWSQENEVKVIYTYPNPFRKSLRYLKKSERYYLRHGYEYNVDGINVNMYEVPLRYHQKMLNKSQNKHISTQINNCLRKSGFNPDVIISHVPSFSIGYIDLLNLSVPKVAVLHQTDINRSMIDLSLINEFQEKFDYSFARSQYIYNYFQKHKLSNLKTEVISSGVKLPKHQNTKSSFKDKEFFNILFVGKLIKRKRVHIILKALQRLKEKFNFKFTIVGKGNEKRRLQKLVKKLDLQAHVVFKGEVSRKQVFLMMNNSDIFVMPSINETFGLVYLEAMSFGCITIGTKNEGIDGVIKNGINGYLVEPRDETGTELSNILEKIMKKSRKSLLEISNNAINTAEIYNEQAMSNRYWNLIKGVINDYYDVNVR